VTGPTRFQTRSGALGGGTEQGFWTPGAPNAAPDPQIPYLPLETPAGPDSFAQLGNTALAGVLGVSGALAVGVPTTFRLLGRVRGPRIAGVASISGNPGANAGITVLGSGLVAQKETEGTANFIATAPNNSSGVTILGWDAGRTAILNAPTLNNGNSLTQEFSQAYGNGFTNYSLRGHRCYAGAGGANHALTGSKSSSVTEEATGAILVLSGGQIGTRKSVVQRVNAGAGATLTSGTVTMTAAGLLVAVCSGDGNVNATAPTQTWPGEWTVLQSVAYSSAQAPNGHVPLYLAVRAISTPGDYSVGIQMTIDEGATIALYGLQ